MKRRKIGFLVLVVLIIVAAIFGWMEYNRKVEPVSSLRPAFEVSVLNLIQEFEANDSIPSKKYFGKLIAVNGPVRKVEKDNKGFFTVVMGDKDITSSVRCAMDSLFANEVVSLQTGQTITIKGMFTGFQKDETGLLGSDIILNRCVIDTSKLKKLD